MFNLPIQHFSATNIKRTVFHVVEFSFQPLSVYFFHIFSFFYSFKFSRLKKLVELTSHRSEREREWNIAWSGGIECGRGNKNSILLLNRAKRYGNWVEVHHQRYTTSLGVQCLVTGFVLLCLRLALKYTSFLLNLLMFIFKSYSSHITIYVMHAASNLSKCTNANETQFSALATCLQSLNLSMRFWFHMQNDDSSLSSNRLSIDPRYIEKFIANCARMKNSTFDIRDIQDLIANSFSIFTRRFIASKRKLSFWLRWHFFLALVIRYLPKQLMKFEYTSSN